MDWFLFHYPTDNFWPFVRWRKKILVVQKFLYFTTDISLPFFKYQKRKNVPAFEKSGDITICGY